MHESDTPQGIIGGANVSEPGRRNATQPANHIESVSHSEAVDMFEVLLQESQS